MIENERDEEVEVGGVEGGLPQPPAGLLQILDLDRRFDRWRLRDVDLTGLSAYAPDDPCGTRRSPRAASSRSRPATTRP